MKTRPMTKRVLAIVSPDAPERSLLDALADMRIEYDLLENPQEALNMPPDYPVALDLAILILEYPSMSGPELAWRLRRRCPRLPILMRAEDLGTWEESDIRDLGVNVIVDGPQDHESFRNHLTLLFEENVAGAAGRVALVRNAVFVAVIAYAATGDIARTADRTAVDVAGVGNGIIVTVR